MMHGTTILAVRHRGQVVLIGDGQVTLGETIVKGSARKVRRLAQGRVVAGFAGSTADAMTLFDKFDASLRDARGRLVRAAVDLARKWRTDEVLRRLEALLVVADARDTLIVSGAGDVIEPDDDVAAVGSGGPYALSAARALVRHAPTMAALDIARAAMEIAASVCIYTNAQFAWEILDASPEAAEGRTP